MSHSRHKIPKSSRPSTGYERQSYGGPDHARYRKETEVYVIKIRYNCAKFDRI